MTLTGPDGNGKGNLNPVVIGVLMAVVGAVGALVVQIYGFQNSKVWENTSDIAAMKAQILADHEAARRTDQVVETINTAIQAMVNAQISLKDANDAQAREMVNIRSDMADIRKQFGEITRAFRPPPDPPH